MQMPAFKPYNASSCTPHLSSRVKVYAPNDSTERPTGKYWVVVDESQCQWDSSRCYVYRNGALLAQGHGRTGRDAFAEARRNVRMARHCAPSGWGSVG
jgi:hypothetical protein